MEPTDGASPNRRTRFAQLYEEMHPTVMAYVVRRVPEKIDAGDVVADVFTVVWRRFDQLPQAPADRLWVYGVARRCVADATRSSVRRARLKARLGMASVTSLASDPDSRLAVREAIAALPNAESEALRLTAWDGLSHEEAAHVLGCSVNAVAIRVHRARKRLKRVLGNEPAPGRSQLADGGNV